MPSHSQVTATDGDFGPYSNLYYEIVSEEMKKFFVIDQTTGVITSRVTFDREKKDDYEVLLKVSDGGGLFGFATLKVSIVDVNDNVPYFPLKEYKIVLSTATESNKTILTVRTIYLNIYFKYNHNLYRSLGQSQGR